MSGEYESEEWLQSLGVPCIGLMASTSMRINVDFRAACISMSPLTFGIRRP
jgi:hypothetical protein